jgi:histidyl-tRNA synthetase
LREFFQWNIDIVGLDDVVTDAECIFVAVDFFREVGLTPADMVMKINSRSLMSALMGAGGIAPERHPNLFGVLDKRDKLPQDAFLELIDKAAESDQEKATLLAMGQAGGRGGLETIAGMAAGNSAAEAQVARLREVLTLLERLGVGEYCVFDMGVVRELAYYTGVVFEAFAKGELRRAICGGGRYDELLTVLGGPPISGWSRCSRTTRIATRKPWRLLCGTCRISLGRLRSSSPACSTGWSRSIVWR